MAEPPDTAADTARSGPAAESIRDTIDLAAHVERYRAEGMLGRGGMGVVSSYFDRIIGRHVAFKELRRDVHDDDESRARFVREARVQGQLEHPAIVPVYDIGARDDGSPYFTMKTVRGVTLATVLEKLGAGENDPKYAPHRLLSAFSRVCLAIAYAHERGVLHRDLKPANLILGEYGEVYVLDWGLAKVVGDSELDRAGASGASSPGMTSADTLLGTPGYMAPEQIDDARSVTAAADVYALGAILFELVTLEPLHARGYDALGSTRAGVEARPSKRTPARHVAPELEAAIVRATALDPAVRGTPRELSEVVDRYLEGERDLELRRATAATHAHAALRAVTDAMGKDPHALDARRAAMKEINRALVLDPSNTTAMETMIELLSNPPETPPPELVGDIARTFRRDMKWISSIGAGIYFSMLGFIVVLWWMGIRQILPVALLGTLMVASGTLSVIVSRSKVPSMVLVWISVVTSSVALGVATRMTSPFVIVPCAVAINATGYAVLLSRLERFLVMAVSCAAFLVPLALELLGVIEPTFAFTGGKLVLLPVGVALPELPAIALFVTASVAAVVIGTLIIGHVRARLADAEQRMIMYAWHLRELVPQEVRTQTPDPLRLTKRTRDGH